MSTKIFVNLSVTDLRRSIAFYMAMGFMYSRTIADPDGHRWEPFFMDMAAVPQQQQ